MRRFIVLALLVQGLSAQTASEIRKTVERALPALQQSAATFVAKRACVSCHHNILPIMLLHLARAKGIGIDSAALHAVEDKTFRTLRGPAALDDAIQANTLNDPTPDDSYLLMAAYAAGLPPDLTTAVYARRIANWQRDGHWVTSDFRPPHSSSLFTATATAIRAIALYMPDELRVERDSRIALARQWLVSTQPASTEDAAFRLMGLVWANATKKEIAGAVRDLKKLHTPGSGWPQLPGYPPDAYSTGEALYAMREAGVQSNEGHRFLLSTQAADGTWRVHTRMISPAQVSPEYFQSGFPYGKDEYLSYAGSAWAVMALLDALPGDQAHARPAESAGPSWIRAALFSPASQLGALDPNRQTDNGTTLLMMAANDPDKVRLLLARGARVTPKVLAIAAAYRGTAPAIEALLNAGADAKNAKAMEHASMTGDLEVVQLLLARGADPAPGLSQAVTFGYPDIVRALIAAGASAKGTESSGINLLHWAAITNHPEVVPALLQAGVPLNATDDFLYTPLMYAATIDFGDDRMLRALLRAGADKNIRNDKGRTALEQARHFHHTLLETDLQ